jgi:hypothetical protein
MWTPHISLSSAANVDSVLGSIQSLLAGLGLGQYSHAASLWVFFAACGVTELAISFLICTPLERFWPLTSWPKRNSIAADGQEFSGRNSDHRLALPKDPVIVGVVVAWCGFPAFPVLFPLRAMIYFAVLLTVAESACRSTGISIGTRKLLART